MAKPTGGAGWFAMRAPDCAPRKPKVPNETERRPQATPDARRRLYGSHWCDLLGCGRHGSGWANESLGLHEAREMHAG